MLDRKLLLGSTVMAGFAAALAVATPAVSWAQTAPATSTTSAEEEEKEVEALVVTGSRIKRTEFTSAAPVQVITSEQATLEGLVDTTELLQQSSVASGSFQVNNMLTGFVVDGGPGVNTISLRGLGANRTLVLLNGRRVGPAGVRGTVGPVDLNVIPQSLIDRVEILKDGASSIYGSDAIAGVVNIITKSNLDGGELSAYGRAGQDKGGEFFRLNGAWGKTFDRGYINGALDYSEQKALRRSQRDDLACSADYLFDPVTGQRVDYRGLDGNYKCYNLLNNVFQVNGYGGSFQYREAGITYPGTTAAPAAFGPAAATLIRAARPGFPESYPYANYSSKYDMNRTVISPVKRTTLTITGGFDLTPSTELYGELLYNKRESEQSSARQLFPTISRLNPNNTYGQLGFAAGVGNGTSTPVIAIPYNFAQEIDYYRAVVGVRGNFGEALKNWDWDIYAQVSKSDGSYTGDIVYNDRVLAVTGDAACSQAAITISGGSCASLPAGGIPWLTPRVLAGDFTDAERAFLFGTETGTTTYDQALLEGSISGDLFALPAGPLGAALGFSIRHEEIDDQPGATAANYNIWGLTSAGRTKGDDTVKEIFGELAIPVAKGLPGIEALDLSASARYTDYDSYGSNTTYKLGANWQIVPAFRVRATYGTSFRAPALYELSLGGQTGFLGQTSIDPCIRYEDNQNAQIRANCAAIGLPLAYTGGTAGSALIQTFGGTDLKAEESKAFTLGVIWTPSFLDLSVAVDYFDIQVDDEVTRFGAANILEQCYKSSTFPVDPFCTLFTRDAAAAGTNRGISYVNDSYTNIASQVNRGIDLTFRYAHEFDVGTLTFSGQFTWQLEDVTELMLGAGKDDFNGTTNTYDGPDFTGSLNTRFDRGDWTFNWAVDLIGKGSDTEVYGGDTFPNTRYYPNTVTPVSTYYKQYTEFTALHDVSVRRRMDDWTFVAGITNVFDERPPSASAGQFRVGTAALNMFDVVGRSLFINVSKKW